MIFIQILWNLYLRPHHAMDTLAKLDTPLFGAAYTFLRGLMVSLLFYLPFYLLKFEPITPPFLKIFDTPNYFLYAVFLFPVIIFLSWVYLQGVVYVILRLLGYKTDFDQMLNLGGWLNLGIGIVLLLFDWFTVALGIHANAYFMGISHVLIADPWSITLTTIFFKKYYGVPPWLSVLLGILARILYIPLAMVFIRT